MKPAKPILAATVLAGTVFAFPVAHAQKRSNFYLGGALGQSTFKEFCVADPSVLTCDDTDTGWKLFGGYQFNPYFAIEGAYIDWGEVAGTLTPGPRVVPLSQTGMGISVVGSIPLPREFSLFGKFGLFRTEQDVPASSVPSREDTETQLGLGARLTLTPSWAARAEWERMTESKVEMLSIGLEYRF